MKLQPSLLAPVLLFGLSCEDQPYTSELLDARSDTTLSQDTYVSDEVREFLNARGEGEKNRSDGGIDALPHDGECPCSCEKIIYQGMDEYKKKVETALGPIAATTFDNLLQLYHTKLGISFLSDTMSELADTLARVAAYSRKMNSFQVTVQLLTLPAVQKVVALYEREEGDSWNATTTLTQIAAQTRSSAAVMETARCLEAYVGKSESESGKLAEEFQSITSESFGYSLLIIKKARECVLTARASQKRRGE
ncbi:MAG: hypothetical protein AABX13_04505 [Nanoarchaeota archaeon]